MKEMNNKVKAFAKCQIKNCTFKKIYKNDRELTKKTTCPVHFLVPVEVSFNRRIYLK